MAFALITEGITDQVVLESIICGHYEEDIDVHIIQPMRDATDESRQSNFGGWERVFEYCESEKFKEIFIFNEYLIIQVDTDTAEHANFGVSYTHAGTQKSISQLVSDVRSKIQSKIDPVVYEKYKERIFFAIAVHSVECWLLPLHAKSEGAKKKIVNCEDSLSRVIHRNNQSYIKDYECYYLLSKDLSKNKHLLAAEKVNESLNIFLMSLPKLIE